MLAGAVDEVQQHAAALDMAEEAVAEPGALMRAFDQAGNVGEHEFAPVDARTTPRPGMERRERDSRRSSASPRVTAARKVDLPALGRPTRPASAISFRRSQIQRSSPSWPGIGAPRRAVGRGLEMGVAEAAVAALGEDARAGRSRSGRRSSVSPSSSRICVPAGTLQHDVARPSRRRGSCPCRARRSCALNAAGSGSRSAC